MKKTLIASAALAVLIGTPALAADMPLKAPPLAPPPAYSWTGCYVDGGVGYGMWKQDHFAEDSLSLTALTQTTTTGGDGWLGRVGGGCDYQAAPRWVFGAFADYDFANLKGKFQDSVSGLVGTEKESGAWAAGARVGFLLTPSILTYVSGGYTQARFDQINLSTNTVPVFATPFFIGSNTYKGWFLGGGTETALADFVSGLPSGLFLRTEYRFSSYQANDIPIQPLALTLTSENMKKDVQTITTSLVWRFWSGPR